MSPQGNNHQETNAPGDKNNVVRSPESDLPFWSAGSPSSGKKKEVVSRHFILGVSPLIPAVVALLSIIVLVYSGWFQRGLRASGNLPIVQAVSSLFQKNPPLDPGVRVWVRMGSGFYYCRGNVLFGRRPGRVQAQGEALTSGYRPANGQYCSERKQEDHSPAGPSSPNSTGTR